jgi:hypothetical protein
MPAVFVLKVFEDLPMFVHFTEKYSNRYYLIRCRPILTHSLLSFFPPRSYTVVVAAPCSLSAVHKQFWGPYVIRVRSRFRKASGAFMQLYPVCRNHNISKRTKLRIFNTNVKSVLLYACETWKVSQRIINRLQGFINRCLRCIINIYNQKLYQIKIYRKLRTNDHYNPNKEEKMALDRPCPKKTHWIHRKVCIGLEH